jgi:O-glycosyl hydrolase
MNRRPSLSLARGPLALAVALAGAAALAVAAPAGASAGTASATVNGAVRYQEISGFGASEAFGCATCSRTPGARPRT